MLIDVLWPNIRLRDIMWLRQVILFSKESTLMFSDAAGNVRIWDVTQPEKSLKGEYRVLAGSINDLSWDSESKHLIVVGEGRDKYLIHS